MKFLRFLLCLAVFLLSIVLFRDSISTHILPYMILAGTMCIFALLKVISSVFESFYFLVPPARTYTQFSYFILFYIYYFVQSDSNSIYIIIAIIILLAIVCFISIGYTNWDNFTYIFLTAILFKLYGSSENMMNHKLLLILNFILFGIVILHYVITQLYYYSIVDYSVVLSIQYIKLAIILAMTVLFIISKVKIPETPLYFIIASGLALITHVLYTLMDYDEH